MRHLGSLVTPLVDGQLPPARAESANEHLITCPSCQQAVAAERAARAMARSASVSPASADLERRLMALQDPNHPALNDRTEPMRTSPHPVRNRIVIGAVASLSLFALSLFLVGGQHRAGQEPSEILATDATDVTVPVQASAPVAPAVDRSDAESRYLLEWMAAAGWISPDELPGAMVAHGAHVLADTESGTQILRIDLDHDGDSVTVLEQRGQLDPSKLAALTPVQVGAHQAYLVQGHWWVLQCGDWVIAVTSGEDADDAHELIRALPETESQALQPPSSVWQRIVTGWHIITGNA